MNDYINTNTPDALFALIRSPMLMHFAKEDEFIPPSL
jgi:hypothetical protein